MMVLWLITMIVARRNYGFSSCKYDTYARIRHIRQSAIRHFCFSLLSYCIKVYQLCATHNTT